MGSSHGKLQWIDGTLLVLWNNKLLCFAKKQKGNNNNNNNNKWSLQSDKIIYWDPRFQGMIIKMKAFKIFLPTL